MKHCILIMIFYFDVSNQCLTPIQEYTEMLMKMEKKDSSTQTKSNIGPCRVHSCRAPIRSNAYKLRGKYRKIKLVLK